MTNFNLTHKTLIQKSFGGGDYYEVKYPLTIEFTINKGINNKINEGNFKIYNLSKDKTDNIFQDYFDYKTRRQIFFEGGYNNSTTLCFSGDIYEAYSERQGTDIITTINAREGGWNVDDSYFSQAFSQQSKESDVITALITNLGFKKGVIQTELKQQNGRGETIEGKTYQILEDRYPNQVFINGETINILDNNQYIKTKEIKKITSASGLLSTPKKQNNIMSIEMLFDPSINLGELIEVDSEVNKYFNGQYKIIGYTHTGTIGGLKSNATTSLQLSLGSYLSQLGGV